MGFFSMARAFYHASRMGIIGERPESGLRIDIERPRDGGPPWRYDGTASTTDAKYAMRATVEENGDVAIESNAPEDVAEKARLIIRTAYKHARSEDEPPPRRIQRWRSS
jgi:hypothetical protein